MTKIAILVLTMMISMSAKAAAPTGYDELGRRGDRKATIAADAADPEWVKFMLTPNRNPEEEAALGPFLLKARQWVAVQREFRGLASDQVEAVARSYAVGACNKLADLMGSTRSCGISVLTAK